MRCLVGLGSCWGGLGDQVSAAKRHHWWPQCHSEIWTDDHGLITMVFNDGSVKNVTPINAGVIGRHNAVKLPNGGVDTSLETFFANEVDTPAAPLLRRLASEKRRNLVWERSFDHQFVRQERRHFRGDGFLPMDRCYTVPMTADEQLKVARYVASLLVRVPSYKDELNSTSVVNTLAALLDIEAQKAKFEVDKFHVRAMKAHLKQYTDKMTECAWVIIESVRQEFVFGDTPVIPSVLGWGEAEAICPISPNRCLMFVKGFSPPIADHIVIAQAVPQSVRATNQTMIQNADRFVFARKAPSIEFVVKHFGSRQVRIAPKFEETDGVNIAAGPLLDRLQTSYPLGPDKEP
jgi:hypothetical protein